ncbi:MAG: chemotaxis protein [Bacilli bacterium]|nr:chemotaxis protein [Bacilli bacterium]
MLKQLLERTGLVLKRVPWKRLRFKSSRFNQKQFNLNLKYPSGIRRKLVLTFLALSLVPLLLVGCISYFISGSIIQNKAKQLTQPTVALTAQTIDLLMQHYDELSMQIITNKDLQDLISAQVDPNDAYAKLQTNTQVNNLITNFTNGNVADSLSVSILAQNGFNYGSLASGPSKWADLQNEGWMKATLTANGKIVWLAPSLTDRNGLTASPGIFTLTRVIKGSNNLGTAGVLVMQIPTVNLQSIKNSKLGDNGFLFLTDAGGSVVYSPSDLIKGADSVSKLSSMTAALQGKVGQYADSFNHTQTLITYETSTYSGWKIVGVVPLQELTKETFWIGMATVLILLVSFGLCLLIASRIANSFASPIQLLVDAMKKVATGDLTAAVVINREDEIGLLSTEFTKMVKGIESLIEQVRTTALLVATETKTMVESLGTSLAASQEVASAVENIAQGAGEQAAEVDNGSRVTASIVEKVQHAVEATQGMKQVTLQVQELSVNGETQISGLVTSTDKAQQQINKISEVMESLVTSVKDIDQIVASISSIAEQTNLLSLNAAIEAARAGVHGNGFRVVADEVRKLADQAKTSTQGIRKITQQINERTTQVSANMQATNEVFHQQSVSVNKTEQVFQTIQSSMQGMLGQLNEFTLMMTDLEGARGELVVAISKISAVAQEAAATTEEVSSLTREQTDATETLRSLTTGLSVQADALSEQVASFRTNNQ